MNSIYACIFIIFVMLCIVVIYKFTPSSMKRSASIETFFANSNLEPPQPSIAFFNTDQQKTYDANDVLSKITKLQEDIKAYNASVSEFNQQSLDPVNVYQPYADMDAAFRSGTSSLLVDNKKYDLDNAISTNVKKLSEQVSDLELLIAKLGLNSNKQIEPTTIKSANNGMELCVDKIAGGNNYKVLINGGCLSVGAADYNIDTCSVADPKSDANKKQLFEMHYITNDVGYQNTITQPELFNLNTNDNVDYPFVMLQSHNNKNCLTNYHGQISVEPCSSSKNQRWKPL